MIPDSKTPFEWAEDDEAAAAAAAAAAANVFAAFLGLEPPLPPPPPLPDDDSMGFSRRHDNLEEFTSLASCKWCDQIDMEFSSPTSCKQAILKQGT